MGRQLRKGPDHIMVVSLKFVYVYPVDPLGVVSAQVYEHDIRKAFQSSPVGLRVPIGKLPFLQQRSAAYSVIGHLISMTQESSQLLRKCIAFRVFQGGAMGNARADAGDFYRVTGLSLCSCRAQQW